MIIKNSAASRLCLLASLAAGALAACASDSIVVVGNQRAPISAADVKIYSHPPPAFEEIAILNASTNSMFTSGGQKTVDKVIAGLKEQGYLAAVDAMAVLVKGQS